MTPHAPRSSHNCCVIGSEAVHLARSEDSTGPIVALVDESSPTESVLAQMAGADVVVTLRRELNDDDHRAALELAVHAAHTIARRRHQVAATSRRVGHDVAQALNVIALTAEAGRHGRLDPDAAFDQIHALVRDAGADAWRVAHAHRSSSLVVALVELRGLLESGFCAPDVEIFGPSCDTYAFADERRLVAAVAELIENARRADATSIRVETMMAIDEDRVDIVVSDDGIGFPLDGLAAVGRPFAAGDGSDRPGLGLATIAEYAEELGGRLKVIEPGHDGRRTRIALSLPRIDRHSSPPASHSTSDDQATAQANILEGVVRHAPLDESLEAIVSAIEHQLPGTACSVLLLHDGCRLHHGAGARLPLAYREAIDGVEIGVGQGSCGTAAHTGHPVVADDVTTDVNWTDFRGIATEHDLRSCWSTPIVTAEGGETLGTFAVYKSTVWRPDDAAIRLVNRFTYLAAVAIEHHRLFGALAESEARFRSAFEGAAAGIALAALDGSILKSNPALAELVSHSAPRLVGTNLLDLIEPSHRGVVNASWATLTDGIDASMLRSVEVPLAVAAGVPPTWLSVHTSLIPGEFDRQPYLYVEVRDITAARRQLADLRAREAAEAANRAKTDFLALVSHELRTPLNAILGFAQVMQLLELDEGQHGHGVDQIVKAGRHLRDLIDELLDLSRIESGQLAVVAEPVGAHDVVIEAIELVRPLAAARDIDLVDHMTEATTLRVIADTRCMRQVLINLLDNAVKYTDAGGRVELGIHASTDATVRISVSDSGPGISSDSLDAVFQPFYRLDQGAGGGRDGTGLGLALCARLMHEMDGSIGVSSTVGVGSTFWVEFPAPGQASPERRDVADDRRAATSTPRR